MKTALITGASSGIGYAIGKIFAENNINVIICGRRKEKLDQLEKEINGKVKVLQLIFDVKNKDDVFNSINNLPDEWKNIDILINNAGNAYGLSLIQDGDTDDWDNMIDTNVKGLLYVTKSVLPLMIKNKSGHIINIGSIASKEVYPQGNVYNASKFAVDALNHSMRIDLNKEGIKVSAINPGAVETDFSVVRFKGDKERADKVYQGFTPLKANDIAETVLFVVKSPHHVNISDLTILPLAQASATIIKRD